MTTLLICLILPPVALAMSCAAYRVGYTSGYLESAQEHHAEHIKKLNIAWRCEVMAERMRAECPKNVSEN